MNTQSSMENSHLKRSINVIPNWILDHLADIYAQFRENESSGQVHIIFARGHVKQISTTNDFFAPDDSQKLRAVKKQAS